MANAWKRDKPARLPSPRFFLLLSLPFSSSFSSSSSSYPSRLALQTSVLDSSPSIPIFPSPQFLLSIASNLLKPTQSLLASSKAFDTRFYTRFPISESCPTSLTKHRENAQRETVSETRYFRDDSGGSGEDEKRRKRWARCGCGDQCGMTSFAASAMGFRVLAFEPVFENLQKICEGIYFNRVAELVTVFEAAASDRLGNITFHKVLFLDEISELLSSS